MRRSVYRSAGLTGLNDDDDDDGDDHDTISRVFRYLSGQMRSSVSLFMQHLTYTCNFIINNCVLLCVLVILEAVFRLQYSAAISTHSTDIPASRFYKSNHGCGRTSAYGLEKSTLVVPNFLTGYVNVLSLTK